MAGVWHVWVGRGGVGVWNGWVTGEMQSVWGAVEFGSVCVCVFGEGYWVLGREGRGRKLPHGGGGWGHSCNVGLRSGGLGRGGVGWGWGGKEGGGGQVWSRGGRGRQGDGERRGGAGGGRGAEGGGDGSTLSLVEVGGWRLPRNAELTPGAR